jgi:hypothetical protein
MLLIEIRIKLFDCPVAFAACRLKRSPIQDFKMAASKLQQTALFAELGRRE